jgi:hypothetical protein
MSHNKTSLLASLTGGDADQDLFGDIPGSSDNVEEDLFGNISLGDPLQHSKVSAVLSVAPTPSNVSNINGARPPVSNVPAPPPPAASSLLASSGLLGDDNDDYDPRSDGLFDAVDDEQARLDQEEQRRHAVQQERIEQERARQQEAERAAEQARLSQQMQGAQQQSQQAHAHAPIQGFYRNHNPPPPRAVPPPVASSYNYNGNLQYSTTGGPVQTHTIRRPITTAGMHNSSSSGGNMIRPPSRTITAPTTSTESPYSVIKVTEPMLVASGGLFLNSPYWSYQVETSLKERGHWLVRRRFKHVVALEDRLRQECPGSILPPR